MIPFLAQITQSINREAPSQAWINTFLVAAVLKVVGVCTAMLTARINSGVWAFERWWGALSTAILLLIWLLPWYKLSRNPRAINIQMISALIFTIVAHQIDVWHSSHAPYEFLLDSQRFQLLVGWDKVDINNVHSLGALFIMVPVILSSWHYSYWGMWSSLGLAGALYLFAPLWLPEDSFNWWFYGVRGFVVLGTTLILAYIVTNLAIEQRRKQAELTAANQKLAEQAIAMEQLATSRERNRLARELHDTLAHSLSGTAVQLEAVQILLKADPEAATAELKDARAQIRSGLKEARRAITALRASPLEDLGLTEALRELAQKVASRNGYTLSIDMPGLPLLPPQVEQTIYRITEESLTNIEKHAQASRITLTAEMDEAQLSISIRDNGRGFDTTTPAPESHFGLVGMKERAHLINSTIHITSQPNHGCTVRLSVPLNSNNS